MPHRESDSSRSAGTSYALLAIVVVVVGLAGYLGYVLYPRFDLPAVEGATLLGLAAAAGIASFFSPCSFPLLLGLLGRQVAARASDDDRGARPIVFGGALALGAAVFMLLVGAAIGIGGEALFADVTFVSAPGIVLRATVGAILILLGLVQLGVLPSPMHAVERISAPITRRQARLRRDKPIAGFALFGFGYVLAGFG
jgi:cytochrome c-type biogenesis protein